MAHPSTIYGATHSTRYDSDFEGIFGSVGRGDLGFFQEEAALSAGPICEVGAGTGRVLAALSGVTEQPLIGVEPSPAMRREFEARLAADPALARRVTLVDGEFTRIPLPDASVGMVFAAFRSFQHVLEVEEQLAAMAELRRVLSPGGRLALDAFDPPYGVLADSGERLAARFRGRRGLVSRYESRAVARERQRVDVTLRWTEIWRERRRFRGLSERERYSVRYIFPFELLHLVHRGGFCDVRLYGGYDRSPVGTVPRELVLTARRPDADGEGA